MQSEEEGVSHPFVVNWPETCEWHHEWEWCKACGKLDKPDDPALPEHQHHEGECHQ
jgi:hypothetical protein